VILRSFLVFVSVVISTAQAAGLDDLHHFLRGTQSARGHFTQTLVDRNGRSAQQSMGTLVFQRPGKFRWTYEKPYEQVIVGDGQKLWLFDPDLNQVTVKKLHEAIGGSPAALLAGSNEIEKFFRLREISAREGLEWVEATPKGKDTSFERIRMGFDDGELARMELKDSFGQTTVLRFSKMERNLRVPAETFRFEPPKGADVLSD
jgi:chaperone LolA